MCRHSKLKMARGTEASHFPSAPVVPAPPVCLFGEHSISRVSRCTAGPGGCVENRGSRSEQLCLSLPFVLKKQSNETF